MLGLALETTRTRPRVALNCGERCKLPSTARQPRGRTTVPRSRGRLLTPGLKGAAPERSQPRVAVCLGGWKAAGRSSQGPPGLCGGRPGACAVKGSGAGDGEARAAAAKRVSGECCAGTVQPPPGRGGLAVPELDSICAPLAIPPPRGTSAGADHGGPGPLPRTPPSQCRPGSCPSPPGFVLTNCSG